MSFLDYLKDKGLKQETKKVENPLPVKVDPPKETVKKPQSTIEQANRILGNLDAYDQKMTPKSKDLDKANQLLK